MKLSREIKTGIVAVIALGMAIWGFNFLKGRNIFVGRTHFYAVYDHIDGLLPNTPVLINGMRVGQVKEIGFLPNKSGKIYIHMVLTNTDMHIPKDSKALVASLDLLGAKGVELELGTAMELAETGDTLLSGIKPGMTDAVTKQLIPIKDKAENLIVSLDSIAVNTNRIFDTKAKNNLKSTLDHLNNASASIDDLLAEEKQRLSDILKNVESITRNVKNNNDKLSSIIENFDNISDSLAKSNLASTLAKVDKTMKETSEIMMKINSGKGSIGMLVNNDSLYKHLDAASNDLDLLLEDMRKHPKRYVHFSVFGGKDKSEKKSGKKNK